MHQLNQRNLDQGQAVAVISRLAPYEDFIKVALMSSLFIFMAFFAILFNQFEGSEITYTFPTYDQSCDCHNPNVTPVNQFDLPIKWIMKDSSIFIYAIVFALASIIKADLKWCSAMWLFYVVALYASYLISYETIPLMPEFFLAPVIIQIGYTSNYFYKSFLR